MVLEFRLKTGFFETKSCYLEICDGVLRVLSREQDGPILTIPEEEIESVTLRDQNPPHIEIQTRDETYAGVFDEGAYEPLLEQLKRNLHKKIVCEYERGNKNE